jgi:hypothetical protein
MKNLQMKRAGVSYSIESYNLFFELGMSQMGLKSEISEIITAWWHTPLLRKVYQALSFYLTISGIASLLSGTFVTWKGIFRAGLTFYHQLVREPLNEIFLYFKVDLSPVVIDYLVIYTLLISSFLRLLFVERKNNLKANRIINRKLALQLFMGILFIALISRIERAPNNAALALAAIQIFTILLLPIHFERAQKRAFYMPLLCAISAVGIMGALNSVISRLF